MTGPDPAFQARDCWATSGPRMTGSQRTTAVSSGPASCQLTGHIRPDSAGLRKGRAVPDTEEDGGSTPPAPTTPALSRAFTGLSVQLWIGWAGETAQR
jgi:hypothetical protein